MARRGAGGKPIGLRAPLGGHERRRPRRHRPAHARTRRSSPSPRRCPRSAFASIELDAGRTALPEQRDHVPVAPNRPSRQKIFYRLAHAQVHHAAEAVKSKRHAVSRTSSSIARSRGAQAGTPRHFQSFPRAEHRGYVADIPFIGLQATDFPNMSTDLDESQVHGTYHDTQNPNEAVPIRGVTANDDSDQCGVSSNDNERVSALVGNTGGTGPIRQNCRKSLRRHTTSIRFP